MPSPQTLAPKQPAASTNRLLSANGAAVTTETGQALRLEG